MDFIPRESTRRWVLKTFLKRGWALKFARWGSMERGWVCSACRRMRREPDWFWVSRSTGKHSPQVK